jgi:integrase
MQIKGSDFLDYDTAMDKAESLIMRGEDENFAFLVVCGVNMGLRISDLLTIDYNQLRKGSFLINEKKTNKRRKVVVNSAVLEVVSWMPDTAKKELGAKCFTSNKGTVFSPQHVNRLLKKHFGHVDKKISSHSLRKSWGRRYYDKYKDDGGLEDLQLQFNHSSPTDTLKYIGITQERLDRMYERLV